jgi:GTP cyclohydrolase II
VTIDGTIYLAIETADEGSLATFDANGAADILISGNRAATLKLTNQRDAIATEPVRISRAPWTDLAGATALAGPSSGPQDAPERPLPNSPARIVG